MSKFPKDSEDRSNKPWASSTTTETTLTGRSNELTSVGANLQEISDKKTEAVIKKLDDNKNAPDISDIIGDLVPEDKLKLLGDFRFSYILIQILISNCLFIFVVSVVVK